VLAGEELLIGRVALHDHRVRERLGDFASPSVVAFDQPRTKAVILELPGGLKSDLAGTDDDDFLRFLGRHSDFVGEVVDRSRAPDHDDPIPGLNNGVTSGDDHLVVPEDRGERE